MLDAARVAGAVLLVVSFAGVARAADLIYSTVPGEEVAANGILDVGETITVDLSASYTASEEAVNYQVDLDLSGDLGSFVFTPTSPPSFGTPGSATCSLPTAVLARCFG